jgi:hypothetical protein
MNLASTQKALSPILPCWRPYPVQTHLVKAFNLDRVLLVLKQIQGLKGANRPDHSSYVPPSWEAENTLLPAHFDSAQSSIQQQELPRVLHFC